MANNQVEVDISANDRASEVVANLIGNFTELGTVANVVMGNLAAAAALQGLQAIHDTIRGIKDSLLEAAQIQTAFISAANSTALNLKISLPDAEQLQKQLGKDIAIAAASQPGSNSDYVEVANVISGSIARAYEGKPQEFLKATSELVKGAGVLASSAGIDPTNAGSVLGRFINGSSGFQQLRNIDFFEKNQDLVFKIEEIAKSKGLQTKELQNWTQAQRVEILTAATAAVVTPEFLARLNDTAEAKLQTFQASLFDPQIGLFGFLREIPELGGDSVLDTFNDLLSTIGKFAEALAKVGKRLGISLDPMKFLADIINKVNEVLLNMTDFLNSGRGSKKGGIDWTGLMGSMLGGIGGAFNIKDLNIGSRMAAIVNSFVETIRVAVVNFDAIAFGVQIGRVFSWLFKNLTDFVAGINWVDLAIGIAEIFWKIVQTLMGIVIGFDWSLVPKALFKLFGNLISNMFKATGRDLGIIGFTQWLADIFHSMGDSISRAWDGFVRMLQNIFVALVNKIGSLIPEGVQQFAGNVSNGVGAVGSTIGNGVSNTKKAVGGVVDGISSVFKPKTKPVQPTDAAKPDMTIQPVPLPQPKPEAKPVAFAPNIQVNPSPGMDENALANKVIALFEQNYNSYKNGALA